VQTGVCVCLPRVHIVRPALSSPSLQCDEGGKGGSRPRKHNSERCRVELMCRAMQERGGALTLAALHSCSEVGVSTPSSALVGLSAAPRPAVLVEVTTCRIRSCASAGSTATALGHPYASAIPAAAAAAHTRVARVFNSAGGGSWCPYTPIGPTRLVCGIRGCLGGCRVSLTPSHGVSAL
jgi:hypothetical protein